MSKDGNALIIIDGNSLINRAYYAIQRPMITSDGIYTHGIYGFLTMLNKILSDYSPDYICVTFDRKAPTFRHKEYAEYKAGRKGMPLELAMQLPYMKDILAAMRIGILEMDGYEADDIIGTLAVRGEAAGLEPLIITGDRDALQLVTAKTKVLFTKKGISEFDLYDETSFFEQYGFTPRQFIDYKGLMGDSSDNIPGLPGVGEKTASKLILEYGSVENLIEQASSIDNVKLRAKVEENAELAILSKRLATIVTDAPVESDFEALRLGETDMAQLAQLYRKLEFNSFLQRLGTSNSKISVPPVADEESWGAYFEPDFESAILRRPEELDTLKQLLSAAPYAVLKTFGDGNHRGTPAVYGINIMTTDGHCYIRTDEDLPFFLEVIRIIIASDVPLCGHNLQSDLYAIRRILKDFAETASDAQASSQASDMDEDVSALYRAFAPRLAFDTAVAQYLIDPAASNYALKTLCLSYFSIDLPEEAEFFKGTQTDLFSDAAQTDAQYGKKWCTAVISLKAAIEKRLAALGLTDLLESLELPLIETLADLETQGFAFDKNALSEASAALNQGIEALEKEIYGIVGKEFNINSPQQLGIVLFEDMGLPHGKKSKLGYSTSADILEKLSEEYPIVDKILEYRTLTKLRGTYIEGLIPLAGADGKIHAHFQQTVTATGRLSCTEPNLQNIPIRQDLGRQIRRAFVPESDEYVLLGADYSQIELRVLAHFSEDPSLIEDFRQGADIHRRTAARVFGVANEDDVTSLQRGNAKAVNFGIIYGMSSFGLSEGLGITRKEAERYIADYFNEHRAVKIYLDDCVRQVKEQGFAVTLLGRRRAIPEINAPNYMVRMFGERLAMNTPIQGSAADIIKLAMIAVYKGLQARKLRSRVILQVHDELIVQAHKSEIEAAAEVLKFEMENAIQLKVPLVAEINQGDNWYELK